MNPTLGYWWSRICGALATTPWAVRRHVLADIQAGTLAPGESSSGKKTLLMRAAGLAGNRPYYVAPTVVAAILAVAFGLAPYAYATEAEPGRWSMYVAGMLGILAAICLYQAVARRFGPAVIDQTRLAAAKQVLEESGDVHARPLPVLVTIAMAGVFLIDGAFSGYTLTTMAFSSLFTPRVAMFASMLWSGATAWLLFHLTTAAALESAINTRREVIRNLLDSRRPADRARAEAMIQHVGTALGNNYSRSANRYRARAGLCFVVLGLAASIFVVRVSSENSNLNAAPDADAVIAPEQ